MYSATHERVIIARGRDRKIRTALRTNQIAGFVTVPSEKKNTIVMFTFIRKTAQLNSKSVL